MANIFTQLRDRLIQNRPFRTNWLGKDAAYPSEVSESLAELPLDIARQLTQLAKAQPSNPHDQRFIQEAISAAVKQWQADPNLANNSLIVLSSPVSMIIRTLMDSMIDWAEENSLTINLLNWTGRPKDARQIQAQMHETLGQTEVEATYLNISVIPNLSWCFLRSAEGLDGIDFLRDRLLSDPTQFWVVGSGQVGWQYLNLVLKLKAHCGEVVKLPSLSSGQLQDWLMPIIDQLEIRFDQTSMPERLKGTGESGSRSLPITTFIAVREEISATIKSLFRFGQKEPPSLNSTATHQKDSEWGDYFARLSDLSTGVSTIALQLFIRSICYEEIEDNSKQKLRDQTRPEELETLLEPAPPPLYRLMARLPKLPELPVLKYEDLYILYSLLVHDDLTLDALAESLGEERQIVNDQVQILRKTGVIEQKGQVIKVNPIHYPRLKTKLASNNFIVKIADQS